MKKQKPEMPRWRRALLVTLAIPLSLVLLVGLVLSYQIYASNRTMDDLSHLPLVASPKPPQSLLIFAPHCDDETLGAAGLMYQATHAGCDVHVVVISNGDGFRISVSRSLHKIEVNAADFVRYGYMRQAETRRALKVLGVPGDHVVFLGYPDRGLMPMWTTNWSRSHPFTSFYTNTAYSPYTDSPTPNAPYCGETLLADISRQLEQDKPTDVYITHPNDDHPDHAAASVFVRTALDQARDSGEPWAQHAQLHYYLVHRGDWPVPQGLHEGYPLPPPAQMAHGETDWRMLPLTRYQVMRKYAAIKRYTTQMQVESRFLFSFARRDELFGTVNSGESRALPQVADGVMGLNGDLSDWHGIAPLHIDPVADNAVRAIQSGADISRVFVARDTRDLYVRVEMHGQLAKDVTYEVSIRPLLRGSVQPRFLQYSVRTGLPGVIGVVPGTDQVRYAWRGNAMEFAVPLSGLQIKPSDRDATVDIAADTVFADMTVDKTGYHGVAFNPEPTTPLIAQSSQDDRSHG